MSKIEITSTLTHRSLMNKSKYDLADMVLEYCDWLDDERKRSDAKVRQALDRVRKAGEPYDHLGSAPSEYPRVTRMLEEISAIERELEGEV